MNTSQITETEHSIIISCLPARIVELQKAELQCGAAAAAPPPAVLATPTETVVSTVTVEDGGVVTLTAQPISFDRIV